MNLTYLKKNFDALANEDPLWTVLSDNSKRGGHWDPDEFYAHGENEIVGMEHRLASLGIKLSGKMALDFGCGAGRLTFPLSRRFDRAIGIDISSPMIQRAQENAQRGGNCTFILNTKPNLGCLENESIDFAYSNIVFQHMAPRYTKRYIKEVSRILKPDGHFLFQLPSHLDKRSKINQQSFREFRRALYYFQKRLRHRFGLEPAFLDMNAIPCEKLIRFARRKTELRPVALWDYAAAGPNWHSYLYLFRKNEQSLHTTKQ